MLFQIPGHEHERLKKLFSNFKLKWQKKCRHRHTFIRKNKDWLNVCITLKNSIETDENRRKSTSAHSTEPRGRPFAEFTNSSDRSKRRRTEHLRSSYNTSELVYATEMSLRSSGAPEASSVLRDVTRTSSPEQKRASRYKLAYRESLKRPLSEISSDRALNLIISGNMTKETYRMTRSLTNENCGTSVYPSYKKIAEAKIRFYPSSLAIMISELKILFRIT